MSQARPPGDLIAPSPAAGRTWSADPQRLAGAAAFIAIYAGILLWFAGVDVYHRHFSDAGPLVFGNNLCRVLFIIYLFWIVHAVGAGLLWLVSDDAVQYEGLLERLALRFFAGTGVCHLALLGLGYFGLYTRPVMIAVTLPVVALSARHACAAMGDLRRLATARLSDSRWFRTPDGAAVTLALALFVAVLMIKGLYPSGGHDYFTHYFYYDITTIERGDLQPNDVWYHYYYSKGAGLFFLAMLLTDPLAPQLVSFCFYAASLITLILLLRGFAPGPQWALAGIILFLGLYIYTPGPGDSRSYGGWGDFEKLHELNAALTLALIWLSTRMLETRGRASIAALTASASAITAAVIVNTTAAAFLVAVFGLLMVGYAWKRMMGRALQCAGLAAVAGVVAAATLLVNQIATGLLSDQMLGVAWPLANVETLHRWGALPPLLATLWGRAGMADGGASLGAAVILLAKTLRLEMFGPLLAWGILLTAAAARRGRLVVPASTQILIVVLAGTIGFALTTGIAQPTSFYRYTTFALPVVLLCGLLLVRMGAEAGGLLGRLAAHPRTAPVIVIACFISAFISYHPRRAPADAVIDATRFTVGWFSIDTAYTTQDGWPARRPWGAIYPGARGAFAAVGPHVRILSMHTDSYCMLPGCRIDTWPAFTVTQDWDRLMFGTAEEGREALQAFGLDHFLFSTELYLYDPLPRSPLFSPDNIARYLGIRWTDGITTLLTWLGPGVAPLDAEWVARYRRAVEDSGPVQSFPYADMREVYARLRATPHPWRSFRLRWSLPK